MFFTPSHGQTCAPRRVARSPVEAAPGRSTAGRATDAQMAEDFQENAGKRPCFCRKNGLEIKKMWVFMGFHGFSTSMLVYRRNHGDMMVCVWQDLTSYNGKRNVIWVDSAI